MTRSELDTLPPSIARVLSRFRTMSREDKMQALVQYSKKLEPLPERFEAIDRTNFTIPECQTRVDIFPEVRDGTIHFYADVNVRQSPTVAAFLAIVFSAVNDQPPSVMRAIPEDFVSLVMDNIGLPSRPSGARRPPRDRARLASRCPPLCQLHPISAFSVAPDS
jgi:cysteine desulfuration protein SufE